MPFITIDYLAGIGARERRTLQERLAAVVLEHFAAPASNVRVFTRAIDPSDLYVADGSHSAGLPVIRAEFLPGRTLQQKRALAHGLAHVAAEVLQVPVGQIRTVLYEKERQDWARGDTLVADA